MNNLSEIIEYTKKMTLLYVENNTEVREGISVVLQDFFKEIVFALDGEDGLEKFYENKIDIVMTDIHMPRLNGLEMAKKIIKFDQTIPIIIYSSVNETKYFMEVIELNIVSYLFKPLKKDNLLKTLSSVVEKIKYQKEFNSNLNILHQYQDLTDSNIAVSKTDVKGIITYVNSNLCKMTGYSKEELIGCNHNIVRHKETDASVYADLWYRIKNEKKQWNGILKNTAKDGKVYYSDLSIKPILDEDRDIIEFISLIKDITSIMSPKKQLHDFVEASKEPVLVLIKTDGFTDIERFYGYSLSEKISDNFANNLFEMMPKHLGFDNFLVLEDGQYAFFQDLNTDSKHFLQSLQEELQSLQHQVNSLKIDVGEIEYDISIMISVSSGEKCIENVNYGMKFLEDSRQDFIIADNFSQKEEENAENNLKILKMVKKALETSKIISYFQPIVSNLTQEVVKYESLVRLVDEDGKIISPYYFLDIAKKGKYYAQITAMVLENSFNALGRTDKMITINISALDIEKPSTREKIFELLDLHRDLATRLVFELLEDEDVRDIDEIREFISQVKNYGVKIAIDDFGAGYSNFERLLKYQPDILKIDGSLVKFIETDSYSLSVVKTIVAFAKEQNIELVAEYIENENIFNILKDLGVEYSQGYYFGKPDIMP